MSISPRRKLWLLRLDTRRFWLSTPHTHEGLVGRLPLTRFANLLNHI